MTSQEEKNAAEFYRPWLPLWGAKRGTVVNECPVGIQSQTVTEPAGEKLSSVCETDEVSRRKQLNCTATAGG